MTSQTSGHAVINAPLYLYATATEVGWDQARNKTTVRVSATLGASWGYASTSASSATYSIDGQSKTLNTSSSSAPYDYYDYGPGYYGEDSGGSWDFDVYHDANGGKYVSFSVTFNTAIGSATASSSFYLTDWNRSPYAPTKPSYSRDRGSISYSTSWTGANGDYNYSPYWNSSPGPNQVDWYYGGPSDPNATTYWQSDTDGADGWTASMSGMDPRTTYYVKAFIHNTDGWSPQSDILTVYGVPQTPAAPSGVRSTDTAGKINLWWTAPSSNLTIDYYHVYRDGPSGVGTYIGAWNGATPPTSTAPFNFSDTGLSRGSDHTYYVYAHNSSGWSDPSTASISLKAPGVPNAPATPTVTSKVGRTVTVNSARGSSDYGNTITEYRIQLSTDNGVTWKGWDNSTKKFTLDNSYNVLDGSGNFEYLLLTPALTYKWRVYAVNSIVTAGATPEYSLLSAATFVGAGGRRYRGTGETNANTWQPTEVAKRYGQTSAAGVTPVTYGWIDLSVAKRYNGTSWVDLT